MRRCRDGTRFICMLSGNIGLHLRDLLMPCQKKFRDSLPITVLNLKNYPFPVIMCSVHYEEIEFGRHALSFAKKTLDYRLIKIDTINRDEYRAWHDDIVMDYLGDEDPDENYCN